MPHLFEQTRRMLKRVLNRTISVMNLKCIQLIFLLSLSIFYACDYQHIGVPGPENSFFLRSEKHEIKDTLLKREILIDSIIVDYDGVSKLSLQVVNHQDRIGHVEYYKLVTVWKNGYSNLYACENEGVQDVSGKYTLNYNLYAHEKEDQIFVVLKENPLELFPLPAISNARYLDKRASLNRLR